MPIISLEGQTITYYLRRSARARRLRIEYGSSGVKVIAPVKLSNRVIIQFLFEQKQWLLKQTKKLHIRLAQGRQEASLPSLPLSCWDSEAQVLAYICSLADKYSQSLGQKPRGISLKTQRRRWGSCGIHNHIYINKILIRAPQAVLDYVVLHECCHLIHRNHGRHFWALVKKHMPDYKVQEKWLRQYSEIINYNTNEERVGC